MRSNERVHEMNVNEMPSSSTRPSFYDAFVKWLYSSNRSSTLQKIYFFYIGSLKAYIIKRAWGYSSLGFQWRENKKISNFLRYWSPQTWIAPKAFSKANCLVSMLDEAPLSDMLTCVQLLQDQVIFQYLYRSLFYSTNLCYSYFSSA